MLLDLPVTESAVLKNPPTARAEQREKPATLRRLSFHQHWVLPCRASVPMQINNSNIPAMPKVDRLMATNFNECITACYSMVQCHMGFRTMLASHSGEYKLYIAMPTLERIGYYQNSTKCPILALSTILFYRVYCHNSGHWVGQTEDDFSNPSGWTNYYTCMLIDWEKAQSIARGARNLEFVGLALSFVGLITAIIIFSVFRRLRVFRNQVHLQLMLAILLTVVIRLVLYVDQIFTQRIDTIKPGQVGTTINSMNYLCEAFYVALEYGKTVAFAWMFIEGFYLHNIVVVTVFEGEPKMLKYIIAGWGIPLIHVSVWLIVVIVKNAYRKTNRCLGNYYLEPEFWIMDGVRLSELLINFIFLLNIIRVLWSKVKETHSVRERQQMKKSVKAALMLIPLLGTPNILQTIPFNPTTNNIVGFAIFTYVASFFYMFQGFMVAVLYCFTNREVVNVIKCSWERYCLKHGFDHRHLPLLPKSQQTGTSELPNRRTQSTPNL
ncbi:Calcitonin receptor-like protein 1 [Trichinella britovi]|uniref:Calcitonin receptor-like protein 1 n=2 Tax=Trichinella britovi TaxID=45882 RepID=A0A0V1D8M5_TRIBR|nr:Calcitonin receptor-like protein 1 [Trichinella britovi]